MTLEEIKLSDVLRKIRSQHKEKIARDKKDAEYRLIMEAKAAVKEFLGEQYPMFEPTIGHYTCIMVGNGGQGYVIVRISDLWFVYTFLHMQGLMNGLYLYNSEAGCFGSNGSPVTLEGLADYYTDIDYNWKLTDDGVKYVGGGVPE